MYRGDWLGNSGIDELGYNSVVFKTKKPDNENVQLSYNIYVGTFPCVIAGSMDNGNISR
jgi:hypothetical protein